MALSLAAESLIKGSFNSERYIPELPRASQAVATKAVRFFYSALKTVLIVAPTTSDLVSTGLSLFNLGADTQSTPEYLPLLLGLIFGGGVVAAMMTANRRVKEKYAVTIRMITAALDEFALVNAQALRTYAEFDLLNRDEILLKHGDFYPWEKVMLILLSISTATVAGYFSGKETKQATKEQLEKIESMRTMFHAFMNSDLYRNDFELPVKSGSAVMIKRVA